MLASINPLGERGRNQHYRVTVTAYVAASAAAGAALGATLGLAGTPLFAGRATVAVAVAAALAAAGIAFDLGWFGLRVPGPHRQVDENWLSTYRGWVYGAGFGAQLGLAFTTIVNASAAWVAFACALLSGSVWGGLLIGAVFGLVRALPILLTAGVREPSELRALVRRLERTRPRLTRVALATQAAVALAALGALAGGAS